jgi:hypothetical protein
MSAFIKQIRESIKRRTGVDPIDEWSAKPGQERKHTGASLSRILKECPRMTVDPEFPDDSEPTRIDRKTH